MRQKGGGVVSRARKGEGLEFGKLGWGAQEVRE